MGFVYQSYRFGIGFLYFGITRLLPVQIAQCKLKNSFLHTVPSTLLYSFVIGGKSLYRIFFGKVYIAQCIINLIEVFFVFLILAEA